MRDLHGVMCFACGVMAMCAWNEVALVGFDVHFAIYTALTVALNFYAANLQNSASPGNSAT
jgi:hypothetical protein